MTDEREAPAAPERGFQYVEHYVQLPFISPDPEDAPLLPFTEPAPVMWRISAEDFERLEGQLAMFGIAYAMREMPELSPEASGKAQSQPAMKILMQRELADHGDETPFDWCILR